MIDCKVSKQWNIDIENVNDKLMRERIVGLVNFAKNAQLNRWRCILNHIFLMKNVKKD